MASNPENSKEIDSYASLFFEGLALSGINFLNT